MLKQVHHLMWHYNTAWHYKKIVVYVLTSGFSSIGGLLEKFYLFIYFARIFYVWFTRATTLSSKNPSNEFFLSSCSSIHFSSLMFHSCQSVIHIMSRFSTLLIHFFSFCTLLLPPYWCCYDTSVLTFNFPLKECLKFCGGEGEIVNKRKKGIEMIWKKVKRDGDTGKESVEL